MQVLHTITSAAKLLGITTSDIQRLIISGQIEIARINGKTRLSESALNRYLLSRVGL